MIRLIPLHRQVFGQFQPMQHSQSHSQKKPIDLPDLSEGNRAIHLRQPNNRHTLVAIAPRDPEPQPLANIRLDELILIARLWPRGSAWVDMDFGRPTLERNHLRKFTTHSTHNSADTPSRSMMGSRLGGIAARLSVRTCRERRLVPPTHKR